MFKILVDIFRKLRWWTNRLSGKILNLYISDIAIKICKIKTELRIVRLYAGDPQAKTMIFGISGKAMPRLKPLP